MNKIYYKNRLVKDTTDIEGFVLNIAGDNHIIKLNPFAGGGIVYVSLAGEGCEFSFGRNNQVNNDIGVSFWNTSTSVPNKSIVSIGDNNFFNGSNISIIAPLNTKIIIGDGNLFAGSITFWGRNDHIIYDVKTKARLNNDKDIIIGDSNWICQNVTFLPKGQIGNNNVVAWGSIVNNPIYKNNAIIAGAPAKVRKKGINWSRSTDYNRIDFENNNKVKE